jgi:hypothetical protein
MTPFEKFFEREFERLLSQIEDDTTVFSNGISICDASWDRKAAYLLWVAMGQPGKLVFDFEDLL